MSVAYDVRARATAARMLAPIARGGKGQSITLSQSVRGTSDPATGPPVPTVTTLTVSGVVFEYPITIRSRGGQRDEPNTVILSGDKQLLLSPTDDTGAAFTPHDGDIVTIAGVDYTITAVGPLAPAGTVIYFECNIRGAPAS